MTKQAQKQENAHSKLGGSVIHRRIMCPGSLNACKGLSGKTSVYAQEGTAAHTLAQVCLDRKEDTAKHLGETITNDDGSAFEVTDEMAEAVDMYVSAVRSDYEEMKPGVEMRIEQRFNLNWLAPGMDMFGTNDALLIQRYGVLKVDDLKYGQGIVVVAENNDQLRYYALAALYDPLSKGFRIQDKVICEICQPRVPFGSAFSQAEYAPEDLISWGHDVLLPGAKRCLEPDAPLKAGDWCAFCPAAEIGDDMQTRCPKLRAENYDLVSTAFDKSLVEIESASVGDLTLPEYNDISLEAIGKILQKGGPFVKWMDGLKAYALEKVMGQEVVIPGIKTVRSKKTRYWEDASEVRDSLSKHLGGKIYGKPKMLTVAQMEKAIKKEGLDPSVLMAGLVGTKQGAMLAPSDDKRPEYLPTTDFDKEPVE